MQKSLDNTQIFVIISLILLAVIAILWLVQSLYWIIIKVKNYKNPKKSQYYKRLLQEKHYNCQVKKVNFIINFFNYNAKINCLKLNNNDYQEKTNWNLYRNLIHVLLVKWKKEQKQTRLILILIIISFYLSIVLIITCTLIYYINSWLEILSNIEGNVLSIFSFIALITLILTWVFWTMTFEKVRKEVLILAQNLDIKTLKVIKNIVSYKILFPGSESLF